MNTTFVFFTLMYGLIHQNPLLTSQSLTTIECGQKLEILEEVKEEKNVRDAKNIWTRVKFKNYIGYVPGSFLSQRNVSCFGEKYPEFFNSFDLSLQEMSLWAKLFESYVEFGKD